MKKVFAWGAIFITALVLPVAGVVVAGKPAGLYLEFPPVTRYVEHAGFAWPVFAMLATAIVIVVAPFEWRVFKSRRITGQGVGPGEVRRRLPWWGWGGLFANIIFWVLAWSRFEWFAPFQQFTFSSLWFSYIVVVNAWTYKRTGSCMMTSRPRVFGLLFLLSAVFWWYFEYLNRFVQNWYYVNVGDLSAWKYFLFATLPFSTVLPAVLGTYELLKSSKKAGAGLDDFIRIDFKGRGRLAGVLALGIACAGLAGIGVWPDCLFPLLWLSPLLIVVGVQAVMGYSTVFSPVRYGCWRNVYLLALAALVCGGFWEMWNFFSFAQWKYTVPYVQALLLFEMPLLGYAGYLPFGIECAVVAEIAGFNIHSRDDNQ